MAIIAYITVRNERIKMSFNRNTVGWGCKLEALKDMGIKNSDYDKLVDTVSGLEHKVEVDYHDYGFEEAHVIGHGNSDGYKSGGYILPNSSGLKKFVVINGALMYETTIV
jgi:hypothetical protein